MPKRKPKPDLGAMFAVDYAKSESAGYMVGLFHGEISVLRTMLQNIQTHVLHVQSTVRQNPSNSVAPKRLCADLAKIETALATAIEPLARLED